MYISRIALDTQRPHTMKALSSPQVLHAMVEGCFAEKNRTLWRIDPINGQLYLLIVSQTQPTLGPLATDLSYPGDLGQTKSYAPFLENIQQGQRFRFRFKGNPIHNMPMENGKRGKVVPLKTEENKRKWLMAKAEKNGFSLDENFTIVETGLQQFFKKSNRTPVKLSYATFEGILTVTDVTLFTTALTQGIGRGKGYGCGLMTIIGVS